MSTAPKPDPAALALALDALIAAGASDTLLASAARELLSGRQAGASDQAQDAITPSVSLGAPSAPTAPASPAPPKAPRRSSANAAGHKPLAAGGGKTVILDFRDKQGARSSVSFSAQRWRELLGLGLDESALRRELRLLAGDAPGADRSRWVFEEALKRPWRDR